VRQQGGKAETETEVRQTGHRASQAGKKKGVQLECEGNKGTRLGSK
jgi:hypothetical protein